MGIINLSPDSFYNESTITLKDCFSNKVNDYKNADIIDIGAESTRPGSIPINVKNEIDRLKLLDTSLIKSKFISIDSYKYDVIKYALEHGYNMINDISAGGDNYENIELAIEYDVPIILMHMQGNPKSMQINPKYNNLIDDILDFLSVKINSSLKLGLKDEQIIIDPGIGFGKTFHDNYKIINNIKSFKEMGYPLLIGISRKSFLSINNDVPKDRLVQSLALLSVAAYNGADIFRVHDVKESFKVINIINTLSKR